MKKHIKIIIFFSIIPLLVLYILYGFLESTKLKTTVYQYTDDQITTALRICHLTDLHGFQYGKNNERLLRQIEEEKPDLIFMTGDMVSSDSEKVDFESFIVFLENCNSIAPVYYSLGNHEKEIINSKISFIDFKTMIDNTGVTLLEKEYVDVSAGSQIIRIGGVYGYLLSHKYNYGEEQQFLDEFTDITLPTFLLSHLSEGLLEYRCAEDWNIDYVFCGHSHGGQIRLPIVGGLYDPEVRWFPRYSKGLFEISGTKIILSSGLGSSSNIPRLWNPPEIIVFDIDRR